MTEPMNLDSKWRAKDYVPGSLIRNGARDPLEAPGFNSYKDPDELSEDFPPGSFRDPLRTLKERLSELEKKMEALERKQPVYSNILHIPNTDEIIKYGGGIYVPREEKAETWSTISY